jgi:hypothetical protein
MASGVRGFAWVLTVADLQDTSHCMTLHDMCFFGKHTHYVWMSEFMMFCTCQL